MRLAGRLGFTEVDRFEEYGAEQWFGVVLGHAVRLSLVLTARWIHTRPPIGRQPRSDT